jgi:general nucleoside transport system permease protein
VDWAFLIRVLAGILAESAPLVYASVGETLTEKAGMINLSLDGSILLSAMAGFAAAYVTHSVVVGFVAAIAVGAAVALVVAVCSIRLRLDQVAVGFVLTLLTADLSSFLGNPFVRKPGPAVPPMPIPFLRDIPVLGPLFFEQTLVVYGSFVAIVIAWLWMFKTRPGLEMQGVGERPAAAFARGIDVNRLRYVYAVAGGALVGIAGASYSLSVKLGWSFNLTLGIGWIALAIVIFGGWNPLRAALGAYLFGALQTLGGLLQGVVPGVPTQVLQAAPFAMMILVLVLVRSEALQDLLDRVPGRTGAALSSLLLVTPPGALGTRFDQE